MTTKQKAQREKFRKSLDLAENQLASIGSKYRPVSGVKTCATVKKIGFCTECHQPLYQIEKDGRKEILHCIPTPPPCSIREKEKTF